MILIRGKHILPDFGLSSGQKYSAIGYDYTTKLIISPVLLVECDRKRKINFNEIHKEDTMKVTRKINSDNMWLKIKDGKDYVMLTILPVGFKITGEGKQMLAIGKSMIKMLNRRLEKEIRPNDAVEDMYTHYSTKYADCTLIDSQ